MNIENNPNPMSLDDLFAASPTPVAPESTPLSEIAQTVPAETTVPEPTPSTEQQTTPFAADQPAASQPDNIIDLADIYIRTIFIGIPFTLLYNMTSALMRALGDSKRPLYFLLVASFLNIGLDLLCIIVFKMGVFGAAFATVFSQAVAGLGSLWYILKHYNELRWNKEESRLSMLAAGHRIGEAVLLFEKIEDDVIQRQLDKLAATKAANASAEAAQHVEDQKETTTFDNFQKMDIRVSTVLAAEKVAKTKKLLKLTVDTGIDKREIVSGIAEYYTPEELVGKQVLVLVNLEPRELKGILSRGMILMAQDASGKLRLLQPDDQTNPGATVG